jgi:hypothetical protein
MTSGQPNGEGVSMDHMVEVVDAANEVRELELKLSAAKARLASQCGSHPSVSVPESK